MTPAAQVRHEYDGDDVPDFVAAGYQAGQTRWNLEPLLDGGYHRVDVAGAKGLLQSHQKR